MVPRNLLLVLVVGLPILVTTFAVLMAGQLLAAGIGDATSQFALRGAAVGVLVLLAVDLLLLVGALGVNHLDSRSPNDRPPDSN